VSSNPLTPDRWQWIVRPHEPGQPARHVAELSEALGTERLRANVWRYEPGGAGLRRRHRRQEELYLVLEGTLTAYLGEPPAAVEVPARGVVRVPPGTPVQSANHGSDDLLVAAFGAPPEEEPSELLPSALSDGDEVGP
jgi:mannose-6-phosphate isomerase-like protein (cupin superfamily)